MLTETDCPDLPVKRYRRLESTASMSTVVQCLAELRNETPEQVASQVWAIGALVFPRQPVTENACRAGVDSWLSRGNARRVNKSRPK